MATMVGLSAVAVQGFRAPAVQQAADQVMSGLSLARQTAITKNTRAAFLIAHQTNSGFPSEPFRHWAVVYLGRGNGTSAPGTAGGWTFAKDWEPLPNGAVFSEIPANYSTINLNQPQVAAGEAVSSADFISESFTVYANPTTSAALISSTTIPCVVFRPDGSAMGTRAVRISQGTVMDGNATVTGTNAYYYIETDATIGRIRMRSPESYKTNK
jgi:hypothetical protein